MSKKSLVVQHNAIVEARYKLSVGEQRLIKTLASMIDKDDVEFKPYTLRVADFAALVGIDRKDYHAAVKETAESLMSRPFTLIEGSDTVTMNWFSSVRYKTGRGVVEIRFDPVMKPYLLQLKERFTKYELGNVLRLKKTYSIRMYELCKQYQNVGHRRFGIDELREILCLDSGYNLYGNIKNRVLLDSQKELAETTDISFDFKEVKEGRKVMAVDITIFSNTPGNQSDKPTEEETIGKAQKKPKEPTDNEQVKALIAQGVSRTAAIKLAAEYGAEQIARGIAYTQIQQREGKIKNPIGFLVEAIKNGYRDEQAEARQRQEDVAKEKALREARSKEWEELKAHWGAWREAQTKAYIATMDEETLQRAKAAFRASIVGDFAMTHLAGKTPQGEEHHFRIYVTKSLTGLGLLDWARTVGVDISPYEDFARSDGKLGFPLPQPLV